MKKYVLIYLLLFCFSIFSFSQDKQLHQWVSDYNHVFFEFNSENTKVLVVTYELATLWDLENGKLIKSVRLPKNMSSKTLTAANFKLVDASPNLDRIIIKLDSNFFYYSINDEMELYFPNFDGADVKDILGFDSKGWIVYRSVGFKKGFYAAYRDGEFSLNEFIGLYYPYNYFLTKNHNFIGFTDKNNENLDFLNLTTKEVFHTKIDKPYYWRENHLSNGQLTVYHFDDSKSEGNKIRWRYFIDLEQNDLGKKLKGEEAQSHFPEGYSDQILNDSNGFLSADADYYYRSYFLKSDIKNNNKKAYILKKHNKKTNAVIYQIDLMQSATLDAADQKKQLEDKGKADAIAKAKLEALKPTHFREFIAQFPILPSSQVIDYDRVKGVAVTTNAFVKQFEKLRANETMAALGRLALCDNGDFHLLVQYRERGPSDKSSFMVNTYDASGKLLKTKRVGYLEIFNGKTIGLQKFGYTTNQKSYSFTSIFEYEGGKSSKEIHNDGCN